MRFGVDETRDMLKSPHYTLSLILSTSFVYNLYRGKVFIGVICSNPTNTKKYLF